MYMYLYKYLLIHLIKQKHIYLKIFWTIILPFSTCWIIWSEMVEAIWMIFIPDGSFSPKISLSGMNEIAKVYPNIKMVLFSKLI